MDDEDAGDDKMWADVDKDLGDILAEAESGNKSSDEDEDSHADGERYDRYAGAFALWVCISVMVLFFVADSKRLMKN